jgi:uncharacterized membrane protein YgcG
MTAVQRLRAKAMAAGNLQSNDQIQVVNDNGNIEIWPAQDQSIYVPSYDPSEVYSESAWFDYGPAWGIGAWLNMDFNWPAHRLFYHGWQRTEGWITRSRPYIRNLGVYGSLGFGTPTANAAVVKHAVNYSKLSGYNTIHAGAACPSRTVATRQKQPAKKVKQPPDTATRSTVKSHAAPAYRSAPARSSGGSRSGGGGGHSGGGGGGHSGGGGGQSGGGGHR